MLVLKCDRCGSLNDAPQVREANKIPIIPQGGIVEKTGTAPWDTQFERYDLCEHCLKSFDTWMKFGVGAPPVGPAIVGKEETPDPFTPVKLPEIRKPGEQTDDPYPAVKQRLTNRVPQYAPDENSLDSQE